MFKTFNDYTNLPAKRGDHDKTPFAWGRITELITDLCADKDGKVTSHERMNILRNLLCMVFIKRKCASYAITIHSPMPFTLIHIHITACHFRKSGKVVLEFYRTSE